MRDEYLFPPCASDAELEQIELDVAMDEYLDILDLHPGKKCLPALDTLNTVPGMGIQHCLVCEHETGDPHYAWRRLMIINRPAQETK